MGLSLKKVFVHIFLNNNLNKKFRHGRVTLNTHIYFFGLKPLIDLGPFCCRFNIQALKLYRYVGGMGDIVVLFDLIFILVTLIGWYRVLKMATRDGFKG